MTFSRILATAALSASLIVPAIALAGKAATTTSSDPLIVLTGISQFDGVFGSGKGIQDKVIAQTTTLKTARTNVNTALGVATDAPLATAMADLSAKADKKITVAMNGTMPKLTPDAALPDNVKAGVDSVNGLIDAGKSTVDTCLGLKKDAESLVAAASAFPGQVPSLVTNPLELAKKVKVVGDNIKAIGNLPKLIDALVVEVDGIVKDIKAVFPA